MLKISYQINGEGQTQELKQGNYIVGRSKSCDIVIREGSISGQHIRIDVTPEEITFRDLLSRNGTVLNGKKVTQGKLVDGDTLRLGHIDLIIASDIKPQSAAFSTNPEFDLAPPPLPANAQDNDNYALAEYVSAPAAVEVFQMPADGGFAAAQPAAKAPNRVPVLMAILALVAVLVGGVLYVNKLKREQEANKQTEDPGIRYWREMNTGVEEFRLNNYENAIRFWLTAEERYEKATDTRQRVGKTFAQIAEPFKESHTGNAIDLNIDWMDLRRKLLDMINQNILSPELRDFASDLEGRCRREINSQSVIQEAQKLRTDGKWEEAQAKYGEIASTSIYFPMIQKLLDMVQQDQLDALFREALNLSSAKNYPAAITTAEEYFKRGGKNENLTRQLDEWRNQVTIDQELTKIRRLSQEAVSVREIESARVSAKGLQDRFSSDPRVISEIPGILEDLSTRLFILQLSALYDAGNSKEMQALLDKEKKYKNNPQVVDIIRRWEIVSALRVRADAAEKAGDIETALAHCRAIIATEKNNDNRYNAYARGKIKEYPPEKLGQMMVTGSAIAFKDKRYRMARELLAKAQKYGVNIDESLANLHKTGRALFNQGVQDILNKEFISGYERLNDARDCFSPEDPYFTTINTWMEKNNVSIRGANEEK